VVVAAEENYRFEFEELYFRAIAESEKVLIKNSREVCQKSSVSKDETGGHQASIVKLVALNVPKFSGNYKEWSTFKYMFTALWSYDSRRPNLYCQSFPNS